MILAEPTDSRQKRTLVLLVGFLLLVFASGGGSRGDILSLMVLRPAAVIVCGIAFLTLRREMIQAHLGLFIGLAAIFLTILLSLIPLPPEIWHALPGRDIVKEADKLAGLQDLWRPLTMAPAATRNALFSMFVPLGVLSLGVQLSRQNMQLLLPLFIGFALLGGMLGAAQVLGSSEFYFYRITNEGMAVGLFANRNHHAVTLAMMFPMLAVFASSGVQDAAAQKMRSLITVAVAVGIVPLLLMAGSRAGLLLGIFGVLCTPLLYRKPIAAIAKRKTNPRIDPRAYVVGFALLAVVALTIDLNRASSLQRLIASESDDESRLSFWGPVWEATQTYFPVGTGPGAFAETYKIFEPYDLLSPTYLNHAHNDWLELLLTAGLPGLILIIAALAWLMKGLVKVFRGAKASKTVRFGRLGGILIVQLLIASAVDYPLRTPTLVSLLIVAALWLTAGGQTSAETTSDDSPRKS